MFNVNCFICSRERHITEMRNIGLFGLRELVYSSPRADEIDYSKYYDFTHGIICSFECEKQLDERISSHTYKYIGDIKESLEYVKKWEQDNSRNPTTGRKIAKNHHHIYESCVKIYKKEKENIKNHKYWNLNQKYKKKCEDFEKILFEQFKKNFKLIKLYEKSDEYMKNKEEEKEESEKQRKIYQIRNSKSRLEKIKNLPFMTSKEHNKYRCKKCLSICSQYSVTESDDGCCHSFACSCSYSDRTYHYFSCKQCDWKELDCGYTYEEFSSIWKTSKLLEEEKTYD